jgi:hypothetical protein
MTPEPEPLTAPRWRTRRSAAVAGIVFAVLLMVGLVIVRSALSGATPSVLSADPGRRRLLQAGLNLVPFAGIAFLWFIGVVRDRIGQQEDRLFATVFLGSGLLFTAMLFAGAAFAAGLNSLVTATPSAPEPGTLVIGHEVTVLLLRVYAMRMAAVFTLSTAMITLRTKVIAPWIGFAGIAVAIVLLVSIGLTLWVSLLFPAWILVLSVDILRTGLRRPPGAAKAAADAA